MRDGSLDRLFLRFRDRADGAALAALFDRTAPELLAVARHLVRDTAEAEDLVQSTFLVAIAAASRYDPGHPVQAWLHGILWREAAKSRRRASRRIDAGRLPLREVPEPADELAAAEVPAAVARALERLPARYREVLEPHVRDGRGAEEIAATLGRSAGTVRSQIRRGLESLRRGFPGGAAAFSAVLPVDPGVLARVRAEVLGSAGVPVGTAALAAGSPWVLGGVLMSKLVLVAAAVALAVGVGMWAGYERGWEDGRALAAGGGEQVAADLEALPDGRATSREPARAPRLEGTRSVAQAGGAAGGAAPIQDPVAYWLGRFNEAPDDWRHGWKIAGEIAALPPEESLRLMTALWPSLSVPVREQALKPFVFEGKANVLPMLHLAAADREPSVQERAFGYLRDYAFQDFSEDVEAYRRWHRTYGALPPAEVVTVNAQRFVADLAALTPAELGTRLQELPRLDLRAGERHGVDLPAVIREAGGTRLVEIALEDPDHNVRSKALGLVPILELDEDWLRRWVLPAVERGEGPEPEGIGPYFDALAQTKSLWAVEPVMDALRRAAAGARTSTTRSAAQALAEIGDPSVIPALIELMQSDATGELRYDVGYFGLSRLTGVRWKEQQDGAFWLDWWEKNQDRFPPEVRRAVIRR